MHSIIYRWLKSIFFSFLFISSMALADNSSNIPILTYHNFDPSTPGSMTISTAKFEEQIKWLINNGYTILPLKDAVSYLEGKTDTLPTKPIVITVDDGKESVYRYMLPIARKYKIPVTLFIYPSAISKASYALTWQQLNELKDTGLFDIQGHTYWHPNFNQEKKCLSPSEYDKFVNTQLVKSKKVLEDKLNIQVTLLAWPYGIYDSYLEQAAKNAGYEMAFSIDQRAANRSENLMAQPRYLLVESEDMSTFTDIANGKALGKKYQK